MKARFFAVLVACFLVVGCSTTTVPEPVISAGASFDGNERNSGVVAQLPDKSLIVTEHLRARYNELVGLYGSRFTPAIKTDDGILVLANGLVRLDAEHAVKMRRMLLWHKTTGRN